MLLIVSIAILGIAVAVGGWLGSLYLMVERPPAGLNWIGLLHGAVGGAGLAVLLTTLIRDGASAHAVRMGAGGFGWVACTLIVGAMLAGLLILLRHLRHRAIGHALVATHGLLAIVGYTLLVTYLTMLR